MVPEGLLYLVISASPDTAVTDEAMNDSDDISLILMAGAMYFRFFILLESISIIS
jgi:hypothetical protein